MPTNSKISVLQSATGFTLNCLFDVAVRQLAVRFERGSQLGGIASTQHHVERRLIGAKLAFSSLHTFNNCQ